MVGEGDDQLWRSGRCSVLWWGGGDDQLLGSGRGTLITQKMFFAIWGLCWYNFLKTPSRKTNKNDLAGIHFRPP